LRDPLAKAFRPRAQPKRHDASPVLAAGGTFENRWIPKALLCCADGAVDIAGSGLGTALQFVGYGFVPSCSEGTKMEPVNLKLTAHYVTRARQRGYRVEDLAIMERFGTFQGDGLLLREKDVAAEIERLSIELQRIRRGTANGNASEIVREIERLRRLQGAFIPIERGHAVSIYRPCGRRLKYVLRGGRRPRRDRRYWR
jgi:hypothetical protein